jgi:hypothetical protein
LGLPVPPAVAAPLRIRAAATGWYWHALLHLISDLSRNAALLHVAFDELDHFRFGLREISDQPAGLLRRCLALPAA